MIVPIIVNTSPGNQLKVHHPILKTWTVKNSRYGSVLFSKRAFISPAHILQLLYNRILFFLCSCISTCLSISSYLYCCKLRHKFISNASRHGSIYVVLAVEMLSKSTFTILLPYSSITSGVPEPHFIRF